MKLSVTTTRILVAGLVTAIVPGCGKNGVGTQSPLASVASEDVSDLLQRPATATNELDLDTPRDYLPDPRIDWAVNVDFGGSPVSRDKILNRLDVTWLEQNRRPTVYGFSPGAGHWTFVNAVDSPKTFTSLKISWSLYDPLDKKLNDLTPSDTNRFKTAIATTLAELGQPKVTAERSVDEALESIATLPALVSTCDRDVTVVLAAPDGKGFQGREVWDVMLCLGLVYGDGDLFHWINNSGPGDDFFFSVWTSTPPSYFIPKRMAKGNGDVQDLVFGFSIPRSANPVAIFDSMMKAVDYAKQRLGGEILDDAGKPFDAKEIRNKMQHILGKLNEAGFPPGAYATLRVF